MSILAPPSAPANASRRMSNSARIASNVLGTPWPVLWGTRDLSGTLVAWTNHKWSSSGASGKGGGQVSAGEKDYRTFALGLCNGPVDRINAIWYDNQLIWTGSVSIADAATSTNSTQAKGSVIITDQANRGTVAFFFGTEDQDQDPILAQFIPDAPFYRGMCYAVFHGPRNGTLGFRIGNADTLCQIAINVTRIPPSVPGTPFNAQVGPSPDSSVAEAQAITIAADASHFTGNKDVLYALTALAGPSDSQLAVSWESASGIDTAGSATITNGTPFAVGSLGLMVTLSWASNATPPLRPNTMDGWSVLVTSQSAAGNGGANIGSMLYELLTSTAAGFALNPAMVDAAQFNAIAQACSYAGLNYMTSEKADARGLVQDILKNVQGALVCSNGLIGPRLMGYLPSGPVTPALTLEADDIVGYKVRPGAWYEIPQHVTIKYRDSGRLYRDTIASLPGAGSAGNDEKQIELDLPMVTDLPTARLIGLRLKALETLPKKPDTLVCGRAAFPVQFGDIIAVNNPQIGTLPGAFGYQPGSPLVVLAVREHGPGDELIELDVAPDVFGFLPIATTATGSGGQGIPAGPSEPYNEINVQDAFEFPTEWAVDGSKKFCVFAARTDPDAQGFTLWGSSESPPVDYSEVDTDAVFCAGGTIGAYVAPRFTMDRDAYIEFSAASEDIDTWQSVNDNDWFGMKFLVLLGVPTSGVGMLFAAENLEFIGSNVFRITGLWGPLSDTIGGTQGMDIWVFAYQPPYNVGALPNWITGATISFKGIPFGSRLSPTLGDATAAQHTISSRALRPRAAQNPVANGLAPGFNPTYSADIDLAWDLCNRLFGMGAETNPCEFDPAVASEVTRCQVDVVVGGSVVRTATVSVREAVATTIAANILADSSGRCTGFDVASVAGLQPGDRISVVTGTNAEFFGRIASISGLSIVLVSPIAVQASIVAVGNTVNRYESCGYVYDAATNEADNPDSESGLAAAVTFNIYPILNGLRSLNPATITVNQS